MDIDTNNTSGKKVGPIIGALIIVIILVIAALYTWGNRLNKANMNPPAADQTGTSQVSDDATSNGSTAGVNIKPATMSQSDDVDSLSADLDSVNTASASSTF